MVNMEETMVFPGKSHGFSHGKSHGKSFMTGPLVQMLLLPLQDIFNGLGGTLHGRTGEMDGNPAHEMYLWDANIVHHDMLWCLLSYLFWPVARWQFWM